MWGFYAALVGIVFAIIKYTNFRLHQLFDTTDCIEEIVRPVDSTIFQGRSPLPGIQGFGTTTPGGSRNPSHSRTSHSYHHASHHHAIQHYREASPSSRERAIGTRLADIQLTERGYRGGDDDDNLAIGGVGSGGMIELRDLGAISTRNGSGNIQLDSGRTGYENPRRDSNASLTDLTRASFAEASKEHNNSQTLNLPPVSNESATISAETIRERVGVTRIAAALSSATSNLRRRGGNRSQDQNRMENEEDPSNRFNLQVDMHSDPSDKDGFESWNQDLRCDSSNNDDVLEQVLGRRGPEHEKCLFDEHGNEKERHINSAGDNDVALEISEMKSDDVVVIVDESSPEHKLSSSQIDKNATRDNVGNPSSHQKSHSLALDGDCENRKRTKKKSSRVSQKDSNDSSSDRNKKPSPGNNSHNKSDVIKEMENKVFLHCKTNSNTDGNNRRRFSNLSNLAQSLPSTNSSASALMYSRAGLGSVDLAAILNHGQVLNKPDGKNIDKQSLNINSSNSVRRTQSALVSCSSSVISTQMPRSVDKPRKSCKKPNVKLKTNRNLTPKQMSDIPKSDSENLSEDEREIVSGSRSPLLTRSMSLEKISSRQYISGTVSFDPTAGDGLSKPFAAIQDSSKRECSIYSSDMDMETYQAELQEATNALLDARKYLIACDKSEMSDTKQDTTIQKGRKTSWSAGQSKTSHCEGSEKLPDKTYFSLENNTNRAKLGNPNYLGVVGPLDWLFSDSEPEPGPSSPKLVHKKERTSDPHRTQVLNPVRRHRTNNDSCSSQGSSGTDTETRTLLNKERKFSLDNDSIRVDKTRSVLMSDKDKAQRAIDFKATGAIPKKRTTPAEQTTETSLNDKSEDNISDERCKGEQTPNSSQRVSIGPLVR